jgi:hypothetical protein
MKYRRLVKPSLSGETQCRSIENFMRKLISECFREKVDDQVNEFETNVANY